MSENYNQVVKRKGCEARERLQQNKPLTEKDMQPIEFTKKVGEYYSKESIISALDLLEELINHRMFCQNRTDNKIARVIFKDLIKECFQIKRDK